MKISHTLEKLFLRCDSVTEKSRHKTAQCSHHTVSRQVDWCPRLNNHQMDETTCNEFGQRPTNRNIQLI